MPPARKSDKELLAALEASMGNVSAAARALGYTRRRVEQRIAKSPQLQEARNDLRESMTDNAESALNRAILQGEAWAVCFYLKCQGKKRGYIERTEVQQETRVTVSSMESMTDDELVAIVREEQTSRGGRRVAEEEAQPNRPD